MPRLAWLLFATVALAVAVAVAAQPTSIQTASAAQGARPRVTNRCPVDALALRRIDRPALRRLGLELGLHGVHEAGSQSIDYRGARAKARFPTFYTGYVRSVCPERLVKHRPDG